MKNRSKPRPAALCLWVVSLSGFVHATTPQYWNVFGTGGDGVWSKGIGDKNWNLVPGTMGGNTAWQDGIDDVAVFQDAIGGMVTVFDTIQTAGIIQNGANYILDAGIIVLAPDSASNAPFINVQGGVLTIATQLSGTAGMEKTGDGTLHLSGTNGYTGPTLVSGGTLVLEGSLASTSLSISSGAALLNQNGGLSPTAVLSNAGSLTLDTNDIIESYISNGGTLTSGTGTLFATSTTLNDGSTVAGQVQAASFTSNGAVLLSGTATADMALVASGNLTLSGSIIGDSVSIASNASLLNQNGGLSPTAVLSNAGSFTLDTDDAIASYVSNGGTLTNGVGTLFATSTTLNDGSTIAGQVQTASLTSNGAVLLSGTATADMAIVASGTLTLSGSIIGDSVSIASNASLLNQNGGLSSTAVLTNAGSLTLDADDTIASYTSNGGTLTGGTGTLFATSTTLNDGSTVAGQVQSASLTSHGAVLLSGTATADMALVASGTLNLSGSIIGDSVSIASNASLLNQNGGLSPTAVLSNAGSLTLAANDTIASYVSSGGTLTNGAGTLFATSTTLNDGSTVAGQVQTASLTSHGAVLLSGTATTDMVLVASGNLTLSGSIVGDSVSIASNASLLNQNGGLSPTAVLSNAGSLTLAADDTIASYVSNGGTLTNGAGTLFATSTTLNDGSTVAGQVHTASLTSYGAVLLSGTATADMAIVASGNLTLSGSIIGNSVSIASNASLLNQNGGLSPTAVLSNAGSLTVNADDTIASYVSNGGTLSRGAGTLFASQTALNSGSVVAGRLASSTLTSNGPVRVIGMVNATRIHIASGTLFNTGTLGDMTTHLNLNEGATLDARGIQRFGLLTTTGSGPGSWLGDLHNSTTIAPGRVGGIGRLAVDGTFTQSPSASLKLDLSATGSDRIDVSGKAVFGGLLELNQLGTAIAPFIPVKVVSAAAYGGNITSLSENLDGAAWFNPGNGTVTRLDLPAAKAGNLFGANRNQTSTWVSLYDDVIDPGITNITGIAGVYDVSSGVADAGNPDLLWALSASFTPGGLNAPLLNRLSPEVYSGLSDYAIQATRSHQRSALSAPALDPRASSKSGTGNSGPAGTPAPLDWEFFAAVDYFRAGTDNSQNQADYTFDGMGVLTGARTRVREQTQLAVYVGADSGSIDDELIHADALGWTFGIIGEQLLDERSRTRLTAGLSVGSYVFDGHRGSASATAAGWAPGMASFDDVDVDAFELLVGVDGVLWKQDVLTLIPSAGLRYSMSKMDSFGESTGAAPGAPIALDVDRDRHESLLLEFGLLAQVEVNDDLAFWGEGGVNLGLLNHDRAIAARFAKGSRTMRARAEGLDDDSLYMGIGASYQISEAVRMTLGYRADIRAGAEPQQELRLSSSWRF